MEKPTAAHNPEVVGSSPAPATTKTPLSSRKAVFFSAFLQLWGTSPFPGHRGDPNRDPDRSKSVPGGGVSASGTSSLGEIFAVYSAAVRTFSMVLAASFWAAVVTWAYVSSVNPALKCPSIPDTVLMSTPFWRASVAKVCPYGIITTNRKSPVESRVLRFSVWFFILFQNEKSR